MKKKIFLTIAAAVGIGFMSYKFTHAYFTASADSAVNIFKTAENFATPSATLTPTEILPNHVVINEVSPLGDNQDEWVELYNPLSSSVDVSNWRISSDNGSDSFGNNIIIPAFGYAVILTSPTTVATPSGAIIIHLDNRTIGSKGLSNDGSEVHLYDKNVHEVDAMSYGDDTSVFTIVGPSANETLQRFPNGIDTNNASDWHVANETLGGVNQ